MLNLNRRLRILRVLLTANQSCPAYNEFTLGWQNNHDTTICAFFRAEVSVAEEITYFEGDGTVTGFCKVLRRALDAQHYDILHFHYPHPGVIFLLGNLIRLRDLLPSTVYTVHSSFPNYRFRNRMLMMPIFASFRRLVSCSNSSYSSIPPWYKALAGSRLCVIQNGVDLERVDRVIGPAQVRSQSSPFTVVSVGRLIPVKNSLQILQTFKLSDNGYGRLIMIGDGSLKSALEVEIRRQNLETQAELAGIVSREEVYHYLANADLFISESLVEGLPKAVLEAMACRCPVVLSDIPSHREIAQGVDFIPLVHPEDAAGFAREIRRFRLMPPRERADIGDQCRQLVEEHFSLTRMLQEYEALYIQLLQG